MKLLNSLCLVAYCSALSGNVLADEPLVLGVIEAQPAANAPSGSLAIAHLRLAFQYQRGTWTAICEGKSSSSRNDGCAFERASERRGWSVLFNGRSLGPVETQGWRNSDYYSFTGALAIISSPIPTVPDSLAPFSSWVGEATRRPLVAVTSHQAGRDKPVWRREAPDSDDAVAVWPLFKARVPTIPNCKFSDEGKPLGKGRPSGFADVIVFDRVRLSQGGYLLGVRAKGAEECDESGGFTSDMWVMKPATGTAFALEGFDTTGWPYSLNLVDVGAFTSDSSIQAVFFYAGYNEDGYVIYYDGFRKNARFTWGYH
jgi:hypothetical protein